MVMPVPKSFWDDRFSAETYAYGERASRLLFAYRDTFSPGMTAFVPACGEGRDAVFLAQCGLEVTAVDLSVAGLQKGKTLAARREVSVNWVQADLSEWDWGAGQYDVIASMFLHTPSKVRAGLHGNMLRCLKPGGSLYLEGFTKDQIAYQKAAEPGSEGTKPQGTGGPKDRDMLFAPEDIQSDFEEADQRALWIGTEYLNEGLYHTGPAALLRAVFKKKEA